MSKTLTRPIPPRKPAQAAAVVDLRDASFGYAGRAAATNITATLHAGESVALIGPNGSGKSTLLNGLAGLTEHLGGSAQVLGVRPGSANKQLGLLPQADSRNLQIPVSVQQVVAMGLYSHRRALQPIGKNGKAAISEALSTVGLTEHAKKLFSDLSGGQQQRAILARALVAKPRLLLLDEPFNGLDRPNRDALLRTITALRESGCAVVVSTHDLEIARDACTHVMLLDQRMIAFGTIAQALTLENVAATFHDTTVEIDAHKLTTRHEDTGHQHHVHHGDHIHEMHTHAAADPEECP
ncbi:metal ABC transporter ATP-binding protein [Canibacter zhoujuaniae]|uniref:metal ABC transporter ATP-binding protein n=1 Tax=Canibacter zhoujuaniae TaxID=2708343 RepID=UPI00141E2AF2|nr:ABC transporter ATP-binding protein [Canibacter zhoujuaniae]